VIYHEKNSRMKDLKDYYNKDNKKFYRQMGPLGTGKRLLWRNHPTKKLSLLWRGCAWIQKQRNNYCQI